MPLGDLGGAPNIFCFGPALPLGLGILDGLMLPILDGNLEGCWAAFGTPPAGCYLRGLFEKFSGLTPLPILL